MPTGYAEQLLRSFRNRYVGATRAIVVTVGTLFAVPAAPPSGKVVTGLLAAILLAWQWVYFRYTRPGNPPNWLFAVDLSLIATIGVTQPLTVPVDYSDDGIGWASAAVSMTVIAVQWQLSARWAAASTVLLATAYGVGATLSQPAVAGAGVPLAAWMLAEGALSYVLFALVRQGARRADAISARTTATRRQAEVAQALRDDEAEHVAVLHDTVANTLLMVGVGVFPARTGWLAERARTDLELIETAVAHPTTVESVAMDEMLAEVCRQAPVEVTVETVPLAVPGAVATAFCGAVREALSNVAKHAGVRTASVLATRRGSTVTVEVHDTGRGFDVATGRASRGFGLTGSIEARLRRHGGDATITSTPGQGTAVRLMWTLTGTPAPARPKALAAQRFVRGVRMATLVIAGAVLVGMNLPMLLSHLAFYHSPAVQLTCYGVLGAIVAIAAVPILTNRPYGVLRYPLVALAMAASVVATADVIAPNLMTPVHWSFGTVGWFGTLLLIDRPLRELIAFLTLHHVLTLGQFVIAGQFDGPTLLRTGSVSATIVGFQLAVGACGRALMVIAQQAADATAKSAAVVTAHETAERLYLHRQLRYADLAPVITPILAGLADGSLDPGDRDVQHRSAVAAAVIRRLLAERGDHDDPLVAELRAVMDVALRKGVVVDLLLGGERPAIPVPVRRALTGPALTVLALAESTARVTIDGDALAVTVSVVADAAPTDLPTSEGGVETTVVAEAERIWVETQWTVTA